MGGCSYNFEFWICRSLDSPNTSSLELGTAAHPHYFRRDRNSETPDNLVPHSENICEIPVGWDGDSDIEIEQDPPDWAKDVGEEILNGMDKVEKKRQEVLNGTRRKKTRIDKVFHLRQ